MTLFGGVLDPPCAWVGGVVDAGEMLEVKVSVDLGRGDIGMAQELLHPAQLGTGLEQVRGEGVPEKVRIDVGGDALAARPVGDPQLDGPPAEAPSRTADEERLLAGSRHARALAEPLLEHADRYPADRYQARLTTLAEDVDRTVAQVEVSEIEPDDLR